MMRNNFAEFVFGINRPFFFKKTVSIFILLVAGISLFVVLFSEKKFGNNVILDILLHASEGALVGGMCDWFAIEKMYGAVEKNKKVVSEEIGGWVKNEIINSKEIRNRLHEITHDKDTKDKVYLWLDRLLGDKQQAAEFLTKLWIKHVRQFVHDKIVSYKLDDNEISVISNAVGDGSVEKAFVNCFGKSLVELSKKDSVLKLRDAILEEFDVGWFKGFFIKSHDISKSLENIGKNLVEEKFKFLNASSPIKTHLDACLKVAYPAYVNSWNSLPENNKKQCVDSFFDNLESVVIDLLANELCSQRNQLRQLDRLIEWDVVDQAMRKIEDFLNDDLSDYIGKSVSESLNKLEDRQFRDNLENNTRSHLEVIRWSGTVMGFVLGGVIGCVVGFI